MCCLDRFYDHYTTLKEFGDYISDASLPLQSAITNQGACTRLDSPPSNFTTRLMDTSLNFVNGSFARMVRSYSRIDPTITRGYQDILLYLALEDVQNLAAVRTKLVSPTGLGDRLRFFVGMAHIKTLRSDRLAVSSSQVEINADITTSYVYTTKTSTDSTFIRDVSVQLREVRRVGTLTNSSTAKFATITLVVPETVTADDITRSIIPPLSLQVGVGFTQSLMTYQEYPCTQTYTGHTKNTIDNMLTAQSYCALQDPLCSAQGPVPVGPGGSIQFTFPLDDSVWSIADLADDSRLRRSLFIDFMVAVVDKDGKKLVTNLKTTTVLKRTSIVTMCTDTVELEPSIEELLTLDIFLGLVGRHEDFESALVKNEDVTRQANPQDLRRDISSKASNVMTVLVKGDAKTFDEGYAREYTLAVEDIITLHFLNADKLEQVRILMANGAAFRQVRGMPSDLSIMRLVPSDALLELCPLQAIAGRYGCVTRREVAARDIDSRATSIINISPNDATDLFNVSTRAGAWASNLLGKSEFATELGFNHSTIMNERYKLNARYRRGFMISPTTPWRKIEMDEAEVDSVLDLSQITITAMLMSFDANINQIYVSTVPGGVPRSSSSARVRRLLSETDTMSMSASGPVSRMLMTFDSATGSPTAIPAKRQQSAPITTREITSVRDNDNVARALCARRPDASKCGMIRFTKSVSIAQFCQSENDVIARMQPDIDVALQNAFDGDLTAVHITTVAQKNRDHICRPQVRRSMLATTADLIFTVVLEVQVIRDKYFFDEVALAQNMITSVMGLTNTTYFKLCGGSTSDEACARAIAVEQGVMRDFVLQFSLHNPNPEFPFDHIKFANIVQKVYGPGTTAVMSTPIHVSGESTEFHVTISVPFLNVYYDDNITAAMNNLLAGGYMLQDTVQHDIVLDMPVSAVTSIVKSKMIQIIATQYGVSVQKVQILEQHSDSLMSDTTTFTIRVLTLRVYGETSAFSAYSIQKHKTEMAARIDTELVIATFKKSTVPNATADASTTTPPQKENSNNIIFIWIILALIILALIVLYFVIHAQNTLRNTVQYNPIQAPVAHARTNMYHTQPWAAEPYWHHNGY